MAFCQPVLELLLQVAFACNAAAESHQRPTKAGLQAMQAQLKQDRKKADTLLMFTGFWHACRCFLHSNISKACG